MIHLWSLISLGSKVNPASEVSSSVPLPRFRSLFSSLRYIFNICFSCSDWMVTWHPYAGLVISPLASRRADRRRGRDRSLIICCRKVQGRLSSINRFNTVERKRTTRKRKDVTNDKGKKKKNRT